MNKVLRLSMLCLLTMFFGANLLADEITFTAGETKGTQTNAGKGADEMTKDGITISVTTGAFAAQQYRFGKGQTMTVSSTVGNITKVEFTCTENETAQYGPGNFTGASSGEYSYEGKIGTWTGDAAEFSMVASGAQVRATQIVVTVGEADPNAVAAPTISGDTQFKESTTVTITATDAEAALFYTIDGGDPITSGIAYTEPFTLTETATVMAAAKKGDKWSNVVSKEFTKITTTAAANIAAFNALANGTDHVVLTLTNAKVLACNATAFIINDGTAGTELYGLTLTAKQGDILNGTVTGKRVDYNGITEMSDITENTITVTDGTANATIATVAEVADADIFGALYRLENVQVVKDENNYYMKDGDVRMQVYNSLKIAGNNPVEGNFNIEGVVGAYKTTKQFIPTLFEAYTAPSDVPVPTISGDETFTEQTTVTITSTVEGASIYYTLDGTDPASSASRLNYTEPFNITETTTVTACVEDEDGNLSSTVSKTFTKVASGNVSTIADFNALPDDTENVVLTLTNAQVLAKGGNYTIVADATAGTEFYNVSDPALNVGDILNGTITGKKTSYKKVPELTNVTANTLTITEGTATPTIAELSVVAAAPIFATLYKIENVAVSAVNGKNATMTVGETTMALYNQLGTVTLAEGNYDIEGVVGIYNENIQFWPTKMEKNIGDKQDPALAFPEASYNVTLGEEFTEPVLTNEFNVTVVYSSTNEDVATVNASTGEVTILTAGSTTIKATFEENDEYVGSIASYTLVVTDPSWTTKGTFENPFEVADLTAMDPNNITVEGEVWVKGVIIGSCKSNGALEDERTTLSNIAIAATASETENYVPVQLPADKESNGNIRSTLNVVNNASNIGKEVMVKGKILKYMNRVGIKETSAYQIDEILVGISNIISDTDNDMDAPAYNLAGQRVGKNYRGVVVKNGKKFIQK